MKDFCQIVFEAWTFVVWNIQQNQTDMILLRVAGNRIHR